MADSIFDTMSNDSILEDFAEQIHKVEDRMEYFQKQTKDHKDTQGISRHQEALKQLANKGDEEK